MCVCNRKFIMRIAHANGNQEFPWSASCKLENHESCGIIQSFARGLKIWRADGVSPHQVQMPKSTDIWEQEMDVSAQAESKFILPLLFVLFRSSMDWWYLPILERVLFTQSTHSNAISSRNTSLQTPRNNVLWAMWASP